MLLSTKFREFLQKNQINEIVHPIRIIDKLYQYVFKTSQKLQQLKDEYELKFSIQEAKIERLREVIESHFVNADYRNKTLKGTSSRSKSIRESIFGPEHFPVMPPRQIENNQILASESSEGF